MKIIIISFLLLLFSSVEHGLPNQLSASNFQLSASYTPVNFRIFPSTITQTEPVVVFHPTNPQILFASAVTINTATGYKNEGVYVSTNGGLNWFGSDTCKGQALNNHGGDPAIVIAPDGTLLLTHIGSLFYGVYSHYSTDLGASWSNAYSITSLPPEDKGTIVIDDIPSSPYYGKIYSVWVNMQSPNLYNVMMSTTTNTGVSWTSPASTNPNPPNRCSGGTIKTSLAGKIYISWAGVAPTLPYTELFAGFAVSTNGGASFNVNQNIFSMNGINGTLPSKSNIRVNGLPRIEIDRTNGARSGWIYIVTTEINNSPAGSDPDIILHRSTDNGATWSNGIRVNQDALNNGKTQYFPELDVDSTGAVNVVFYDDRNTTSDSAGVMLARSKDGGNTWTEIQISAQNFKPKPIAGGASGYQGDHIALVSKGNKLIPMWMADYSGIYQIWTAPIDLNTIGITRIGIAIPADFSLSQNYPNPFNPSTTIKFGVPKRENITIKIFDISGKIITEIVKGEFEPGEYSIKFDAANLSSGVYFYNIRTDTKSITKSMLIVK